MSFSSCRFEFKSVLSLAAFPCVCPPHLSIATCHPVPLAATLHNGQGCAAALGMR